MHRIILNTFLIFVQLIFYLGCGEENKIFQIYNYTVGDCPSILKTGYFNRDKVLDIAVLDECSNDITFLLNNGDGEFESVVNSNLPEGIPVLFQNSDFNKDGIDDLIIINNKDSIYFLLNSGNSEHKPPEIYTWDGIFYSGLIDDFNSDGIPDVIVVYGDFTSLNITSVSFIGKGDGNFLIKYNAGIDCLLLRKADDINADNKRDILCKNMDNYLRVFSGYGDGTFNLWGNFKLQKEFSTIESIDLNNDMYKDIITAGPPISLWFNDMGFGRPLSPLFF